MSYSEKLEEERKQAPQLAILDGWLLVIYMFGSMVGFPLYYFSSVICSKREDSDLFQGVKMLYMDKKSLKPQEYNIIESNTQ